MISTVKKLPTNIITGFLGAGKTTAILHLLEHKPKDERWAILVNEFGEVGIDGKFFCAEYQQETGVFIREVSGGCMCCTAGLSMKISLTLLLARAKPDRLFIEPTGLGHPKEVIALLGAGCYSNILDLRATITLVDARKIKEPLYTNHVSFNQQLEVADIIVANKSDQYAQTDFPCLVNYLSEKRLLENKHLYSTTYGKISTAWLNEKSAVQLVPKMMNMDNGKLQYKNVNALNIPECGYLKIENQGAGFYSIGWVFKSDFIFDKAKLFQLLHGVDAERIKAIFTTSQGVYGYNKTDNILTQVKLADTADNRIEIIFSSEAKFEYLALNILQCSVKSVAGLKL